MINLLLGAPRSGKSYEATVYHVLAALESGRLVVTNLPVNVDMFAAINAEYAKRLFVIKDEGKVKAFSLESHWHHEWRDPATGRGPLFVVDECQFVMKRGDTPRWLQELASMHGHYGYDWLLISQAYGKLDKDICDMVQFTYYVRKKLAFGEPDAYIRKVYDGLKRPSSQEIEIGERKYKPAYFKFYKSHTQSAGSVEEFTGSDVSNRFVRWKWAIRIFWGIFLFMLAGAAYSYFTQKPKKPIPPLTAGMSAGAQLPAAPKPSASAPLGDYVARAEKPAQMDSDPFAGMRISIKASIVGKAKQVWLFAVSRDGQEIMQQTGPQLSDAGYTIRAVNECLVIVDHPKLSRPMYVYCDAPGAVESKSITESKPIAIKAPDIAGALPFQGKPHAPETNSDTNKNAPVNNAKNVPLGKL